MSKLSRAFTVCSSFLALAAFSGGCSSASENEVVTPKLEIINKTKSALSVGDITAIAGTYGLACADHNPGDPWSVGAGGPGDLEVVKNDTACILTMTRIQTATETFVGNPAIVMDTVWQAGSAFSLLDDVTETLRFYGNAQLDAKTFTTNFGISVLVSDDANASSQANTGTTTVYATRTATLEKDAVPASNYTVSFAAFGIEQDIDHKVDSVSGHAQLVAGGIVGEDYAIASVALTGASSFAEVTTAFGVGLPLPVGLDLPASGFNLPTYDLDNNPQRTIIIRHTDQGVSSYQLLLVTFTNP